MPGVGIWPSDLVTSFKLAYSFSWTVELFGSEPLSHRASLAVSREPFSWGSICTSQPILWCCLHSTPRKSSLHHLPGQGCFTVTHKQRDKHRVSLCSGSPKPPKSTKYNKIKSNPKADFEGFNSKPRLVGVQLGIKLSSQSADPPWNCVVQCSLNWHLHDDL